MRDGVNLENTLIYLNIQEKLRLKNIKGQYLCTGLFFMFFSTQKVQAQNKTNHCISLNFMIICVKGISDKCFA